MRRSAPGLALLAALAAAAPLGAQCVPAERPGVRTLCAEGRAVHVVHADLRRHAVRLHWRDAAGRLYARPEALARALAGRGERVVAVANAGIYGEDRRPMGLQVEGGRVVAPLNPRDSTGGNFFRPRPNAVFAVLDDGTARIVDRGPAAALLPRMREAVQSGPRLLRGGALAWPGVFREVPMGRTAVCTAGPRDVYLVVAESMGMNGLARFLRDRLGCRDALFLDGGGVQALEVPAAGLHLRAGALVGFVSVTERR